jgi:hypothetical protein
MQLGELFLKRRIRTPTLTLRGLTEAVERLNGCLHYSSRTDIKWPDTRELLSRATQDTPRRSEFSRLRQGDTDEPSDNADLDRLACEQGAGLIECSLRF